MLGHVVKNITAKTPAYLRTKWFNIDTSQLRASHLAMLFPY